MYTVITVSISINFITIFLAAYWVEGGPRSQGEGTCHSANFRGQYWGWETAARKSAAPREDFESEYIIINCFIFFFSSSFHSFFSYFPLPPPPPPLPPLLPFPSPLLLHLLLFWPVFLNLMYSPPLFFTSLSFFLLSLPFHLPHSSILSLLYVLEILNDSCETFFNFFYNQYLHCL